MKVELDWLEKSLNESEGYVKVRIEWSEARLE